MLKFPNKGFKEDFNENKKNDGITLYRHNAAFTCSLRRQKNSESQSSGNAASVSTAEREKEVSESVTEAPESEDTADNAEPIVADETDIPEQTTASTTIATTAETTAATTTTQAPTAEPEPAEQPSEVGVREEVKEALDSYEALMNEYCDFMEKYSANPDDISLLMELSDYLAKYTDAMDKLSAIDDIELNDEETKYYLEVTNRVSARLIEVAY